MNWQTAVGILVLALIFTAIVVKGIINKKKGKSSCGCGCEGCAMKDNCHK